MHDYLTSKEAARYLNLSSSTLAKLRVAGGGPAYAKAGRKVLYCRGDLDGWVTTHSRASTSDSASGRPGFKDGIKRECLRCAKRWPA
jgi:excisionase family DNA binding protein